MKIRNNGDALEINDIGITIPAGDSEIHDISEEILSYINDGRLILLDPDGNPISSLHQLQSPHIHYWRDIVDPPGIHGPSLFHIQGRRDKWKHGGTFVAGRRRVRELNTVLTNEINGASLESGSRIILPAGNYYCDIAAQVMRTEATRTWLRSLDTGEDLIIGMTHYALTWINTVTCRASGKFTIEEKSTLVVHQKCSQTSRLYGFGAASGMDVEIYADVKFWKE